MPVRSINIGIRYRNILVKYRLNYLFYKSITLHSGLAVPGSYHTACSNLDFRFWIEAFRFETEKKESRGEDDIPAVHGL